jgi:hypothetical protein
MLADTKTQEGLSSFLCEEANEGVGEDSEPSE